MLQLLRREAQIPAAWLTAVAVLALGHGFATQTGDPRLMAGVFIWLFGTVMWGAFAVVRHAEELALRLGEPLGTLVLTLSVTIIEVSFIVTAMLGGGVSSSLVRDTVFAIVMITLNGMVGFSLLMGGLRHHEQEYNLPGARAYLAVVTPLSVFALVLPSYTAAMAGPSLSHNQAIVIALLTFVLYVVFLGMQTVRHRAFFQDPGAAESADGPDGERQAAHAGAAPQRSTGFHAAALLLTLLPLIYLAEALAEIVEYGIRAIGAPQPLAGVLIAILVLSPEAMGALRAAIDNRLQRAVNVSLGSALATIGLTIPAVLLISVSIGTHVTLGLDSEEIVLLVLTLIVSMLTFGGGRTNVLQGAVHIVIFLVFFLLLLEP